MKARLFHPGTDETSAKEPPAELTAEGVRDAARVMGTLDEVEERLASAVVDIGPEARAEETVRRPPLPDRPKGRLLFAGVLLLSLGSAGFILWDTFLRFEALGTVTGRIVEIPPPWSGTVDALHVRVGDVVESGEVVATIKSHELTDKVASITDELGVAQAELSAEVARLAFDSRMENDRTRQALADYHSLAGQRLEPKRSRVRQLESELERLRRKIEMGTVRSPVAGRVIEIRREVGEYLDPKEPIVAVVRRGSVEMMIFVRQDHSDRFVVGDSIEVNVDPYDQCVRCRVVRIGEEYREAPKNFEKQFTYGEKLLPVYLSPPDDRPDYLNLRLGSVVRVPYSWKPAPHPRSENL